MRNGIGALTLTASVLCAASAAAKHTITEFDAPGATGTYVSAVDKDGDIAGVYIPSTGGAEGYVRKSDGSFVFFDQAKTFPETINRDGNTAGYTLDANSDAFVAGADGSVTVFSPPGADNQFGSSAEALTSKGDAAGYFVSADVLVHGFVRNRHGHIVTFDAPGAGTSSHQGTFVYGLTPDGVASGYIIDIDGAYHGFLRAKDGGFTAIDVNGAGTASKQGTRVLCMNAKGTAGGYYKTSDNVQHGFLRDSEGSVTTFDAPNAVDTVVKSVNSGGDVVGFYTDANGASHGFWRLASGKIKTVDAPDGGSASGQGTTATGISDRREIVGYYFDSAGAQHGFYRLK